ncbi:U4/U6 small nuclear ribonucleoprotein Prp31 [Spathaspora sp. JA1]|nr:U4/U6 small nuclear ribonucleoprotein Prp31 [Spathaspora sp. JA1]
MEEDYEKELLADLEGLQDEEQEELSHDEDFVVNGEESKPQGSFEQRLNDILVANSVTNSFSSILNNPNIEEIDDLTSLSRIYPLIPELASKIEQYTNVEETDYLELLSSLNSGIFDQSNEYKFILTVNELSTIINNEISVFVTLIKMQYKIVFPELESLIINPIDYVRLILIFKQDLVNIKQYEVEMKKIISNEKVLVIIMAALHQVNKQFVLSEQDMNKILSCATLVLELEDILHKLSNFISTKLSKFAPNVSAIIGPITTSQLLISTGSLQQLAQTPSCNLPSLGVRDLSSTSKSVVVPRNIRQTGYLFHSELVRYLPPDIIRSVMRIISGKVILAARIDLSKSSPQGELGRKFLEEINNKIEKLLTPPDQTPDKALPVPIEQKSKKRGGKRFRKMKERFQMSELRSAQNKMEFGKEEDTIMDNFGQEIGLGMSRNGGGTGRIGQIKVNTNTNARMSKAMIHRLQKQQEDTRQFKQTMFDDDLDSLILNNPTSVKPGEKPKQDFGSKWIGGFLTMKRRNEDATKEDESKHKQRKI